MSTTYSSPQPVSHVHIPAHVTDHADRFEDPVTGYGYTVRQDTDAENPMNYHTTEHTALWAFGQPRLGNSTIADKPEGNLALDIFADFYFGDHDMFFEIVDMPDGDPEKSLEATKDYLKQNYPFMIFDIAVKTIRGYSQSDWLDVVCVSGAPSRDELISANDLIGTFRQWAFGDVYTIVPDTLDGCSGIYADSPEEALKYFQENFEDEPVWDKLARQDREHEAAALTAAKDTENYALARGLDAPLIHRDTIIAAARELASDGAANNPEYDCALVELSAQLLGINTDDRNAAEITILGRTVVASDEL